MSVEEDERLGAPAGLTPAILAAVTDGITVQDSTGRLLYANDPAARLIGFDSAAELLAAPVEEVIARFEVLDEQRRPLPFDLLPGRIALAEGREETRTVCYRIRDSGRERWSSIHSLPIAGEDGRPLAVNLIRDVTEQRRASDQLRLLSDASELLASSLDTEITIQAIANMLVPAFADYCLIDLAEQDGTLRQAALRHNDPAREVVLREIRQRYPPTGNSEHPATVVLTSGAPLLIATADDPELERASLDEEHLALYRRLEPSSYLVVPLTARGRTIGALSLGMGESRRHYEDADILFAQEVAGRIALGVDNARLYADASESLALLDTLLVSSPVAIGYWDRDLRFVRVNDALAAINGVSAADHVGRTIAEVIPGLAPTLEPLYRRVLTTGEPVVHEESTDEEIAGPGSARNWLSSYYPVRTEAGETIGIGGVIMEITGQRRADARLRLLAEAGELFAASLEAEDILQRIIRVVLPRLADSVHIFLVEGDMLRRAACSHVDPDLQPAIESMPDAYQLGPDSPAFMARVYERSEPVLFTEVTTEFYEHLERFGANREALERVGSRSMMLVPLVARGEPLGVMALGSRELGRYVEADITLATELAGRAAAAIDNGRLFRELSFRTTLLEAQQEASLDGLLLVSAAGTLLSYNRRFAELWEFPVELIAQGSDDVALAEAMTKVVDPDAFIERVKYLYDHPDETSREEIALKNGTVLDRYGAAVRGSGGEYHGWLWSFRDVTDAKRVERERKAAEVRVRLLAEVSEALAESFEYDETLNAVARLVVPMLADYCFFDLSSPDGSLTRVAAAHATDRSFSDRVTAYVPAATNRAHPVGRALRSGKTVVVSDIDDAWIASVAGSPAQAEYMRGLDLSALISVPVRSGRRTLGVLTLGVTGTRTYDDADVAAVQELARRTAVAIENARLYEETQSRAHAAQALEYVGDGVFLVDEEGCIRLWNPAAATITGLAPADVVDRRVVDALPGWQLEGLSPRAETVPVDVDGRELWLSLTAAPFTGGTVYAFRDLTEERAVERLKSDFVSTVSHELRTPLAAIYGAAMTLRRSDVSLTGEQQDGMLGVVAGESERLARIVNDILLASRLDSGAVDVSIGSADAAELVQSVVAAAAAHLPEGIDLVRVVPDDLPAIAADADKVRQVLVNLVENAVKYSPYGGEVRIELEAGEGRMRFAVSDRGLGIPASEHGRIFEKFYRLDPNLTRGVGGTGLGLYICREIVRRMDGRIWVESEPGRGSTFSFDLPLA